MPKYGSDRDEVEDAIDSAKDRTLKIVDNMIAERNAAVIEARRNGYDEGYDKGNEEGYATGFKEGMAKAKEEFMKKEKVEFT